MLHFLFLFDTFTSLDITSIVLSTLVGGGGLAWWLKNGVDLAIATRDAALAAKNASEAKEKAESLEVKIVELDRKLENKSGILDQINARVSKLDKLDEVIGEVKSFHKMLEDIGAQVMPRSEIEAQFDNVDNQLGRLDRDIRDLRKNG